MELKTVDGIEILTLVDNSTDISLKSGKGLFRPPRTNPDGAIKSDTLRAEHGLSLLITVKIGKETRRVLMDSGFTPAVVEYNLEFLGIDLSHVRELVISHGHLDHVGGLPSILHKLGKPAVVVVHPDAFLHRFGRSPDGGLHPYPCLLSREELIKAGLEIRESKTPSLVAGGTILVTGEIPRRTSFEKGMRSTLIERDGNLEQDRIPDDQALVINIAGKGLAVISGCAHSGIINTINYAMELTGESKIHLVAGGFHLSDHYQGSPISQTVHEMKKFSPDLIVPMHCTGFEATCSFARELPDSFALNSTGTRIVI